MLLPASVQNLRDARRMRLHRNGRYMHSDKHRANRRYRRALDAATKRMELDPSRFDNEPFNVKCYTSWDLV